MPATTAIHQLVSTLSWGDAVGNMVRQWQCLLRGWGFGSSSGASDGSSSVPVARASDNSSSAQC